MERLTTESDDGIQRALLDACRRVFPERSELEIVGLARLSDGWECEVYSFTLVGVESGQRRREELILRVYPDVGGERKARREYDVVGRLRRAGYAVPEMLALGRAPGIDDESRPGRSFVVMERIVGEVLGSRLSRSIDERTGDLLDRFCRLLADLHAIDWRPLVSDPSRHSEVGHIGRWLETMEEVLDRHGRNEFAPAVAWLRSRAADVVGARLAVTHGDYHPWNVLLRAADDSIFVIDWTQADVSDYRFDLGWTLVLMRMNLGRRARDATLAAYERAIGHVVSDVGFFEAAAAVRRLLLIVIALTAGPKALGLRPESAVAMRAQSGQVATVLAIIEETTGVSLPAVESLVATSPNG